MTQTALPCLYYVSSYQNNILQNFYMFFLNATISLRAFPNMQNNIDPNLKNIKMCKTKQYGSNKYNMLLHYNNIFLRSCRILIFFKLLYVLSSCVA
jgi:hypothetical protein